MNFVLYRSIRPNVGCFFWNSHSPASPASKNILAYIKSRFGNEAKRKFDIEITEAKPTSEQLSTLLRYYHIDKENLKSDKTDRSGNPVGLEGLNPESISQGTVRPMLVDWYNGRVAINNEDLAKQILNDLDANSKQ